jgi:hypothetical protein
MSQNQRFTQMVRMMGLFQTALSWGYTVVMAAILGLALGAIFFPFVGVK